MGFAKVLAALIAGGTLIPLFAIHMHYKSQGVTLFGSGRQAQRQDIEGLEEEVRGLGERVVSLTDKLGDIHELLADVVLEDHERRHFLSEHGQALGPTSTGDAKGLS